MGKKREAIKQVEKADVEVSRAVAATRDSGPVRALGLYGELTDQPPLFAFAGGVAVAGLLNRDRTMVLTAARMAGAHWLGIIIKSAVKHQVDRTRPQLLLDEGRYGMGAGNSQEKALTSFPSGHTVGAVAIARALIREYPGAALPAYGAAAAAAFARIAKCDHFVSDTAAGAAIGWVAEAIVDRVCRAGRQALPSYS